MTEGEGKIEKMKKKRRERRRHRVSGREREREREREMGNFPSLTKHFPAEANALTYTSDTVTHTLTHTHNPPPSEQYWDSQRRIPLDSLSCVAAHNEPPPCATEQAGPRTLALPTVEREGEREREREGEREREREGERGRESCIAMGVIVFRTPKPAWHRAITSDRGS